jgi:hypothetical protein
MTEYDYELIEEWRLRDPKVSWPTIGKHYNKHHANPMRWFKKEQKRRADTKRQEKLLKSKRTKSGMDLKQKKKTNGKDRSKSLRRITYGKIEPTYFRDSIDTIDDLMNWIKKYTIYKWDTPTTRRMASYLFFKVYKEKKKGLLGAPREGGKSAISTAIYACILLNYYHTQMVIVQGSKGKSRIYGGVLRILKSDIVRQDYGDVLRSHSSQMGEMQLWDELKDLSDEVTDDPSFVVSSVYGIIGAHPYIAWMEDIMQSEAKDEEVNEYLVEEIHNSVIMKLTRIIGGTYTRKSKTDLYSKLPELGYMMYVELALEKIKGRWPTDEDVLYTDEELPNGTIQAIKSGCKIPEGAEYKMIDRPGWDLSWLLLQRTIDDDSFEREMNNRPQPKTGSTFDKAWYDAAIIPPHKAHELKHNQELVIDPSFGKGDTKSDTAYIRGAVYENKIYITEIIANSDGTFEIEDTIDALLEETELQDIHIENDFSQITTRYDSDSRLLYEFGASTFTNKRYGDKMARIKTMRKPFKNVKIKIYDTCTDLDKFKEQFLSFRTDRPKWKWDILDCMASFVRIIQGGSGRDKGNHSQFYHVKR